MSSTSQSTGPDGPPDVHVDSKPSSGAKHSHPLLSAIRSDCFYWWVLHSHLLNKRPVSRWLLGAAACWFFPAISGHRSPRGLFCSFVLSFKTSWMQQLLLFCYVALKWSRYNRLLHRCKGLHSSPPASLLPWCRRSLWGAGERVWIPEAVSSPAFSFLFFLHSRSLPSGEPRKQLLSLLQFADEYSPILWIFLGLLLSPSLISWHIWTLYAVSHFLLVRASNRYLHLCSSFSSIASFANEDGAYRSSHTAARAHVPLSWTIPPLFFHSVSEAVLHSWCDSIAACCQKQQSVDAKLRELVWLQGLSDHCHFRKLNRFIWETILSKREEKSFLLLWQTEAVCPGTGVLFWGVRLWESSRNDGAGLKCYCKTWCCSELSEELVALGFFLLCFLLQPQM